MATRTQVIFFYLGTLCTSFGSLLFTMSVPAFFTQAGIAATLVGITIGVHRFSAIGAGAFFGPRTDRYDSRKVVLWTELLAAMTTVGLVLSWRWRPDFGLTPFWVFCGLRALCIGVQGVSRNRLVKLISGNKAQAEAGLVIWLNKVTQGAHVLSSLAGLALITHSKFEWAILIDGLSFVAGGAAVWALPDVEKGVSRASEKLHLISAVHKFAVLHGWLFIFDSLLSLAVSGTILLMVRLAGGNPVYIIYFNLLFGTCIWLSSVFAHLSRLRAYHAVYWLVVAAGFGFLAFNLGALANFLAYLVAYMGYWILYHKYTVEIQTRTPQESIGGVMAARGLVAAAVLSTGELFGGYLQEAISGRTELLLRAGVALAAVAIILARQMRKGAA